MEVKGESAGPQRAEGAVPEDSSRASNSASRVHAQQHKGRKRRTRGRRVSDNSQSDLDLTVLHQQRQNGIFFFPTENSTSVADQVQSAGVAEASGDDEEVGRSRVRCDPHANEGQSEKVDQPVPEVATTQSPTRDEQEAGATIVAPTDPRLDVLGKQVYLHGLVEERYNWHVGLCGSEVHKGDRVRVSLPTRKHLSVSLQHVSGASEFTGDEEQRLVGGFRSRETQCALEEATRLPSSIAYRIIQKLVVRRVRPSEVRALGCSSVSPSNAYYTFGMHCTLEPGTDSCWISRAGSCHHGRCQEWIVYKLGDTTRRVKYVQMKIPVPPNGPLAVKTFHLEVPDPNDQRMIEIAIDLDQKRAAENACDRESQVASATSVGIVHHELTGMNEAEGESSGVRKRTRAQAAACSPVATVQEALKRQAWTRASADFELLGSSKEAHPTQTFILSPPIEAKAIRLMCTRNFMGHVQPFAADAVGFWGIRFQ